MWRTDLAVAGVVELGAADVFLAEPRGAAALGGGGGGEQ